MFLLQVTKSSRNEVWATYYIQRADGWRKENRDYTIAVKDIVCMIAAPTSNGRFVKFNFDSESGRYH
jgi:hypothetical protein